MKRISGAHQPVVGVPVILEPVEVQVSLLAVPVEVRNVQVTARRPPLCAEHHPRHCSLSSLRAVSYSEFLYSLIFCTK